MASSSPQLLYSIINHLHSLKGSSAIADSEPLDIALQCLNEATKINIDDHSTKEKLSVKYSLLDIFNAGLAALDNPSAAPSSSTSTPSASSSTTSEAFDKFVSLLRTRGFFADCTTPEQEEARMKVAKEKFNQKYAVDNAKSSAAEQTAAPAAPKSVADVSDADKAAAEKAKNEGNAALNQGNYQEAITKYSEAIEKNPFSAIYFSNRAAAYINMAEYVKAESDCRSSIALDPNYPKSRYRLAQTFQARSKFAEAIPEYEKALELAKDDVNMKATIREQLQTAKNNLNGPSNTRGAGERGMGGGAGGNPFGGMDFSSLLSNPAISQMMSNPQFMQMASQMMSGMGGGGAGGAGGGGMPDLSALANNPAIQQMMADPNMAGIINEVKSNPAAMSKYLNDPNIMGKLNSVMGGMGGNAPNNNDGPSSL